MVGLVISGHRDLGNDDPERIRKGIEEFLSYCDFDEFLFGGARGTDTIALVTALEIRGISKWPLLRVVVPDRVENQPNEARPVIVCADVVIELKHSITPNDKFWALRHRNEFMVDWVAPQGRLLAFHNGEHRSGTGGTIRYARSQNVEVSERLITGVPR